MGKPVRQSMRKPQAGKPESDATQIAPDPFCVVLPALCALGAIASIAAVNWKGVDRSEERSSRSRRRAGTALRDLENCCIGLQEIFRRLHRSPKLFAGEGPAAASPLKFGVHGPRIGGDDAKLFRQSINDIASMLVLASQNAFEVMAAIEDGEITPPDDVFFGFGEAQERLNKIMADRLSLKDTVDTGTRIALDLTQLVQQLKSYRNDE